MWIWRRAWGNPSSIPFLLWPAVTNTLHTTAIIYGTLPWQIAYRITMSEYYHFVCFLLLPLVIKHTMWEDKCGSKCLTIVGISGMLYCPIKQTIKHQEKSDSCWRCPKFLSLQRQVISYIKPKSVPNIKKFGQSRASAISPENLH